MPVGRGSLSSIGSDQVLECRDVGYFEELRAHSVLSPNPVEKSLTDDAAVENEGWGAHSSPGVVHGGLAGHKARIRFDEVTIIIAKPLRRLRHISLRCWPAGTPVNYTRGRVCSPSLRDRGIFLKMTFHHEFVSVGGVRNGLVTACAPT